jgi:hypothetical protein
MAATEWSIQNRAPIERSKLTYRSLLTDELQEGTQAPQDGSKCLFAIADQTIWGQICYRTVAGPPDKPFLVTITKFLVWQQAEERGVACSLVHELEQTIRKQFDRAWIRIRIPLDIRQPQPVLSFWMNLHYQPCWTKMDDRGMCMMKGIVSSDLLPPDPNHHVCWFMHPPQLVMDQMTTQDSKSSGSKVPCNCGS